MLTRDQIFAADDKTFADVEVPEWGGTLRVRVMTGAEREAYERHVLDRKTRVIPLMVAMTACDEAGRLLFTPEDVEALSGRSMAALYRVHTAAMNLNKLSADDVRTAEGESPATRSDTSAIASPNGSA